MTRAVPVFFHSRQLLHKPVYEWAFGEKLAHPETTHRAETILAAIVSAGPAFSVRAPEAMPEAALRRAHDPRLLSLYHAATRLEPTTTFYPSVFPKRHQTTPDPADINQAGYFCFDSGTPLTSMTWEAAAWSAACAAEAAKLVATGAPLAYALCRPPGHHAQRDLFGGYCYFNNAAIAASILKKIGRVAIVDIDFHHGNGTQAIFYQDPTVLFVSIHGDPHAFYPYFSGYESERGSGPGEGFTLNVPLPAGCDGQEYQRVLERIVLPAIRAFDPFSLIVSAGLDGYREDPIGRFALETSDFSLIGELLKSVSKPTIVVQEGGYCTEALGRNVVSLLAGLS
jgi:acetoin utilization deacetylase AcuC-like enzyme